MQMMQIYEFLTVSPQTHFLSHQNTIISSSCNATQNLTPNVSLFQALLWLR